MTIMKTLCAALLTASFAVTPSLAMPSSGGPSKAEPTATSPAKKSPKKLKCRRGETAKLVKRNGKSKLTCVKLKADVLPDKDLYTLARLLADDGEYEWALDHLRLITKQNDAEVLNYTGYANRKAGRLETGISYYHQALAINPDYVQAREYLGEAYVLAGFTNLASEQLGEIAKRCGTDCEAYTTLQRFMAQ